jgi:hypothetical protein
MGNASPALIDQVRETVNAPATHFEVVPSFDIFMQRGSGVSQELDIFVAGHDSVINAILLGSAQLTLVIETESL